MEISEISPYESLSSARHFSVIILSSSVRLLSSDRIHASLLVIADCFIERMPLRFLCDGFSHRFEDFLIRIS